MAKFILLKGETSVILSVFIQDSSSTTGAGLSSLDQASSIVGGYMKRGGLGIALAVDENVTTEGTYQAPTTAAQVRIGTPANMRTGVYELHFHNDLFTAADYVTISLGGATNMAELLLEIQLADFDLNTPIAQIVDDIWDEVLTGATHNVTNSSGRRLRQLSEFIVASGTAQGGTAGTITLAASESSVDDIFQGDRVIIVGGLGEREHGIIIAYNGTTKVATMSENWVITPDATSEYELVPADVDVHTWNHVPVTSSATSNKPEVDAVSISDSTAAADDVEANIGNLDAAVSDVLVDTGTTIPALIAALNDVSALQVNAECDTAIADAALATAANLAVVDGIVDAILVDTDVTIPALIAALNDLSTAQVNAECDTAISDAALATAANLATVDGIVDAILVDTATTIPALIAALNDISAAQVNAECDTALTDYDGPTNAELEARTPLVGGRVDANLGSIGGDAAALLNFLASTQVIVRGTVDTVVNGHTPTLTEFQADDITSGDPDHYIGRIVIFKTGLLTFQATDITDFVLVGGIAQFTVTPLTRAPLNNEEFVIA